MEKEENDFIELIDKIQYMKGIVIYGAGSVADLFYAYLFYKKSADKIMAFAVTNTSGNPSYKHGIPVISGKEIKEKYPEASIVVAVHELTVPNVLSVISELGVSLYFVIKPTELRDEFYKELYKLPIAQDKVFILNYRGEGYGGNPKYITEEFLKTNCDLDIVWGIDEKYIDSLDGFPDKIRMVVLGTYEYYQELATSRIWIDNTRKTEDINKRDGQFYIQTWHGAAPFKKVEGDLVKTALPAVIEMGKRDSMMADLFLSGSKFYSALYRKSFWYLGEILESGLPRTDIFWRKEEAKSRIYNYFSINDEKCTVLYAPTFRDDRSTLAYDIDIGAIKKAIKLRFGVESVLMVSKHPLNRNIEYLFNKNEYIDVSRYSDFEELLASADFLITDYSGCIYDYSFSGNPAFLYQPDFDSMRNQRDFYVQPSQMPYPLAFNMEQLIKNILEFDEKKYQNELKLFMNSFGNFDDGKSSERVCERIYSVLEERS